MVLFSATAGLRSLNHVDSIIQGNDGNKGEAANCHGANAKHTEIRVKQANSDNCGS